MLRSSLLSIREERGNWRLASMFLKEKSKKIGKDCFRLVKQRKDSL